MQPRVLVVIILILSLFSSVNTRRMTLMLARGGKRGEDESVNVWEMYWREHDKNAQEGANNCGVWMEFEEYGLGPLAG